MAIAKRITGPPKENWNQKIEELVYRTSIVPKECVLKLENATVSDILLVTESTHYTEGTYKIRMCIGRKQIEFQGNIRVPTNFSVNGIYSLIISRILLEDEMAKFLLRSAQYTGVLERTLDGILDTVQVDYIEMWSPCYHPQVVAFLNQNYITSIYIKYAKYRKYIHMRSIPSFFQIEFLVQISDSKSNTIGAINPTERSI